MAGLGYSEDEIKDGKYENDDDDDGVSSASRRELKRERGNTQLFKLIRT